MAKEIKIEGKKNKNGIIDIEVPDSGKPLSILELPCEKIPVGTKIANSNVEVVKPQTDLDEYEYDTEEVSKPRNIMKEYQKEIVEKNIKNRLNHATLTPEEEEALKEKFVQKKTDEIMKNIEDLSKTYEPYENIDKGIKIDEVAMMKMIAKLFGKDFKTTEEHRELVKTAMEKFHERMEQEIQDATKIIDKKPYEKPECTVSNIWSPEEENMSKNMVKIIDPKSFDGICSDLMDLHSRKNKDYGNAAHESYKEFGITSYVIRLNDKLNRLKSLTKPGTEMEVKDESIIDTLKDLAAYAIMAIESMLNDE